MAWYQTFLVTLVGILMIIKCTPNADCIIDPPSIRERPYEDVQLRCTCRNVNVTAYSIQWCLDQTCSIPLVSGADYNLEPLPGNMEMSNTLTVISAQVDDSHTYYCEGNGTIVAQADIAIVDVPVADVLPDDASITYGQTTTLTCLLLDSNDQSVSEPVIWRKNDITIVEDVDNDGEVDLQLNGTQLMIMDAESADGGTYSCGLDNQELEVKDAVVLQTAVQINENYSVVAKIGTKVTLTCSATGYPLASVQWQGYSSTVETEDLLSSNKTSSLVFPSVKESDDGMYQCSATNGIGETENTYITLSVDSSVWRISPSAWTCSFSLIIMYTCILTYQ